MVSSLSTATTATKLLRGRAPPWRRSSRLFNRRGSKSTVNIFHYGLLSVSARGRLLRFTVTGSPSLSRNGRNTSNNGGLSCFCKSGPSSFVKFSFAPSRYKVQKYPLDLAPNISTLTIQPNLMLWICNIGPCPLVNIYWTHNFHICNLTHAFHHTLPIVHFRPLWYAIMHANAIYTLIYNLND